MEDHRAIKVSMSPKQIARIRKGHKVRVKAPMEGEGVCVIVNPLNYDLLTRTFSRNKGMELALSPTEISVNKEVAPQMSGQGIFGKKFDKTVEKLIGKKAKKEIYGKARELLPLAQAGLTSALTAGGTALGASQPELIPFIAPGVAALSTLGSDYLANPSKYQSNAGGSKAKLAKDLAGRYIQDKALSSLNAQLGTNMGDLSRSSIASALSDKALAEMNARSVAEKQHSMLTGYEPMMGQGLGTGLYAGRERALSRTGGAIGLKGGFVMSEPPALRSQPFGAHFQFQHTLPPAYQKFSSGSGLYS